MGPPPPSVALGGKPLKILGGPQIRENGQKLLRNLRFFGPHGVPLIRGNFLPKVMEINLGINLGTHLNGPYSPR